MKKLIWPVLVAAALPALAELSGSRLAGYATSTDGMPETEPNTNGRQEWDVFSLFDGNLNTYYNANWDKPANEVVFDAGTPRSITGWRVVRGSDYSRYNGDLYLVVSGSNDGLSWNEVGRQQTSTLPGFEDQYGEHQLAAPSALYRYFKFECVYFKTEHNDDWSWSQTIVDASKGNNGYQGLDFREIELRSEDVTPVAALPQVYATNAPGSSDSVAGVVLSGVLRNGAATVEVYCGRKDCGDDYDAWKRSAARSMSALVEKDGAFSFTFSNLDNIAYYWRAFAVVDNTTETLVAASQATRPFAVGSKAIYPEAYVNSSQFWNSYNGNTEDCADNGTVKWQIFDVSNLADSRDRLTSIRLWPRTDNQIVWYRVRALRVYVSYAKNIDWSDFTGTGIPGSGRTIHYDGANTENGTEPTGFDWQQIATGEVLTEYPNGVVELPLPRLDANPAYIKIANIYWGNTKEVEFRTAHMNRGLVVIVR